MIGQGLHPQFSLIRVHSLFEKLHHPIIFGHFIGHAGINHDDYIITKINPFEVAPLYKNY